MWDEENPTGIAWGLCALKIPSAWDYQKEFKSVKVGVIDHSFYCNNPDLIFANKKDLKSNHNAEHGTAVAGIIAATWNNKKGISGILTKCKLYAYANGNNKSTPKHLVSIMEEKYAYGYLILNHVKVINCSEGENPAIQYAASRGNKQAQNHILTNASILSEFLNKLIIKGYDFVIVNSAGNSENMSFKKDSNEKYGYKAIVNKTTNRNSSSPDHIYALYNSTLSAISLQNVKNRIIVVGSIDYISTSNKTKFYQANYSNVGNRIDVYAPGTRVWSTNHSKSSSKEYICKTGTSFAAPHIAGIAGLLYQINPNISGYKVKQIICDKNTARTQITDYTNCIRNLPNAYKCVKIAKKNPTLDTPSTLTGILSGRITNTSGNAINTAKIMVYSTNTGDGRFFTTSSSSSVDKYGNYEIVLPAGTYNVCIYAKDYLPLEIKNITIESNKINYLENTLLLPWNSSYKNSQIRGVVVNALDGSKIEDVTIHFRKGWNNKTGKYIKSILNKGQSKTTTNSSGTFSFPTTLGCYTAELCKNGYITSYYNVVATVSSNTGKQKMILSPILSSNEYRIILTWGETPADLDSHLTYYKSSQKQFHIYYDNKKATLNGKTVAKLDIDDTNSYGPETITLSIGSALLNNEEYNYTVHNYSNRSSTSSTELSTSNATVLLYKGNTLLKTYYIPANKDGTYWNVFKITNKGIITVNKMGYEKSSSNIK